LLIENTSCAEINPNNERIKINDTHLSRNI